MLINILNLVILFFVYSAIGWTIETIYCSAGNKKFINRGFLYGPLCPIYGAGALLLEVFVIPLREPFEKRWWLVILVGVILANTLEYITSYVMEKLFNARWWDYSENFLNLHGRICFKHSCYWAIFTIIYVYLISPLCYHFIDLIPQNIRNIAVVIILMIFFTDLVFTVKAKLKAKKLNKKSSHTESV